MKKLTLISLSIFLAAILIMPLLTYAATNPCPSGPGASLKDCQKNALDQIGDTSGWGKTAGEVSPTDLSQKIGQIISYVLAFLGVVFLVIVVLSGIQWMTAGGNEEKVTKARTRLINATIGLAIVMAAYAITWFVVDKLQTSISNTTSGGNTTQLTCNSLTMQACIQPPTSSHCDWFTGNVPTSHCGPEWSNCANRYPADCTAPGSSNICSSPQTCQLSGNACVCK